MQSRRIALVTMVGLGAGCARVPEVRIGDTVAQPSPTGLPSPTDDGSEPEQTAPPPPEPEDGLLRMAHLAEVGDVAMFVDGGGVDAVIGPFEGTPWRPVAPGQHRVAVSAGPPPNAPGARLEVDVVPGTSLSGVVFGTAADLRFEIGVDDVTGLSPSDARFVVRHAAPGAKAFDVREPGELGALLIAGVGYGDAAPIDLPAGVQALALDTDQDGVSDWTYVLPDAPAGAVVQVQFALRDTALVAATFDAAGALVAVRPEEPLDAGHDTGLDTGL